MNNISKLLWLFLFCIGFSSLYAIEHFPEGFSVINLSDLDTEESERVSKKDEEVLFKKHGYAMSLKTITDELVIAISEWKFARVKYLWNLLQACGGLERLCDHGYSVNSFFLKAAEKGCLKSLRFFLAMPEVDINVKNNKGLNAFDLALYNAHTFWRHLRCLFPGVRSSRSDLKIINGGHLNCAYFLAKQGIFISPSLLQKSDTDFRQYWNCPRFESLQYAKMTSFILYKIEKEKEKKQKSKDSILSSLKELFD